ncbi:MAG: hypothetical protein WA161_21355 [Pseudomonas sp.]|uniref:hypothetical protein n=1 Tax=Pseudomonas sp. TaxID=306 RepID=UPI003BB6F317
MSEVNDPLEDQLVGELSNLIAKHAEHLDGRTFQRAAERVARGYFEGDDLDDLGTFDDLAKAFEAAATIATEGLGHG